MKGMRPAGRVFRPPAGGPPADAVAAAAAPRGQRRAVFLTCSCVPRVDHAARTVARGAPENALLREQLPQVVAKVYHQYDR